MVPSVWHAVSNAASPALRVLRTSLLDHLLALLEDGDVATLVPIRRCDEVDATVTVEVVVPVDEDGDPRPGFLDVGEGTSRI